MTQNKPPKRIAHERLAYNYFIKLFSRKKQANASPFHLLDSTEQRKIVNIQTQAYIWASIYAMCGVLFLYLPMYISPSFFPNTTFYLPYVRSFQVPLAFTLYGFGLAILEILLLTRLNLYSVYKMGDACSFPSPQDAKYEENLRILFEVSLDKYNQDILQFGINPLLGLSVWRIYLFTTLAMLKATLSNLIVKFLAKRLLVRLGLGITVTRYVDLVGIPIFVAWNIYATHLVLREAKVRILAPNLIEELVTKLHRELRDNEEFKHFLLDTLQFVAMSKRNFHHNHYLLTERVVEKFELPKREDITIDSFEFIQKLQKAPQEVQTALGKLFILGLIIDGVVSSKEIEICQVLYDAGLSKKAPVSIKIWVRKFLKGEGLGEIFEAKEV